MTARFCSMDVKWYKLVIGASIGAIYVILSYILLFYTDPMIVPKIVLSILMVYVSFMPKNIKTFFRVLIHFYIITFFIGGISFGIAYFFNVVTIYDGGILYVEEFPVILVAVATLLAFTLGKYIITFIKYSRKMKGLVYRIKVKIMAKSIELNGFYDSGHSVHEPFTNYPVVIIEKNAIKDVVPEEVIKNIENDNFDFKDEWKSKLRVIPIATVTNGKTMLPGFKTDEFYVYIDGKEKIVKNVVVSICDKKLSKDGSFEALLSSDILM
jgi:stage II sporulation protein GA (sporulation sigma-E factor processing peptidase)